MKTLPGYQGFRYDFVGPVGERVQHVARQHAAPRTDLDDVAALPGFLAIVCQDADPSTLIATATEGRAYDADGVLLGAYTDYTEGSGRDALAALGLAPPTPEI